MRSCRDATPKLISKLFQVLGPLARVLHPRPLGSVDVSSNGNTDVCHYWRLIFSFPCSMEHIGIMITIWPMQPVCVVWKHVLLRKPQRDNNCQLKVFRPLSVCVLAACL